MHCNSYATIVAISICQLVTLQTLDNIQYFAVILLLLFLRTLLGFFWLPCSVDVAPYDDDLHHRGGWFLSVSWVCQLYFFISVSLLLLLLLQFWTLPYSREGNLQPRELATHVDVALLKRFIFHFPMRFPLIFHVCKKATKKLLYNHFRDY